MSILDRRGNGPSGNDDLASLEAGLDALETPLDAGLSRHRKLLAATWPPLLAIALLLFVWELTYRSGVKPPEALPSPMDVGLVLRDQLRDGTLLGAMATSLSRGGLGFL